MKLKYYVAQLMVKLQNPYLPWIVAALLAVWRFITILCALFWPPDTLYDFPLKARTCQHDRSKDSLNVAHILTQTLWNKLGPIIDQCSYNPDIRAEMYYSENGLALFHIPNRNRILNQHSCSIVSINNIMHSDAERKLATASPCSFYASDKSIENRAEYQTKAEHVKVLMDPLRKRDDVVAKDESYTYWANGSYITDLRSLITMSFGIQNIDNLIIGPFEHNVEFGGILWPDVYRKLGSRLCQVNMIYQNTGVVSRASFLDSFHKILYQGTFFIVRTSKSSDNKYMNVFSINFNEEYCIERYFKPMVEFERKV